MTEIPQEQTNWCHYCSCLAEPKKVCWVQKSQDMDVSTSALGQLQPSPDLSCLSAEWQHTQEQRQQYAVQI